jgi:DNA polymerase-3 subunit gamma/tau
MHASLTEVLLKENIEFENDAINLIIRNSDGCMRDSLSMLDQVIAYTGGKVDEANTAFLLGYTDVELIEDLLRTIFDEDTSRIAGIVEEICAKGISLRFAAEMLIQHTRNLLFFLATGGKNTKELTSHELDFYTESVSKISEHKLFAYFQIFQKLLNDLKFFSFEQYVFEFAAYKAASIASILPVSGIPAAGFPAAAPAKKTAAHTPQSAQTASIPADTKASEQAAPLHQSDDQWRAMVKQAEAENTLVASYLENVYLSHISGDEMVIGMGEEKKFYHGMLSKPENIKFVASLAGRFYPEVKRVKMAVESEPKKKTITENKKTAETYHQRKTRKEAEENELVKRLANEFGGKILDIEVLDSPEEE